MSINQDEFFMKKAILQAKRAELLGEVPVGAVVVQNDKIISRGYNRREVDHDPLAHAELLALSKASKKLGKWRLSDCTLYVTLEPCVMCAGALVNARVKRVVFGCLDPKGGGVVSAYDIGQSKKLNHRFKLESEVKEKICSQMLKDFFSKLRK